jgi:hypothetical protein
MSLKEKLIFNKKRIGIGIIVVLILIGLVSCIYFYSNLTKIENDVYVYGKYSVDPIHNSSKSVVEYCLNNTTRNDTNSSFAWFMIDHRDYDTIYNEWIDMKNNATEAKNKLDDLGSQYEGDNSLGGSLGSLMVSMYKLSVPSISVRNSTMNDNTTCFIGRYNWDSQYYVHKDKDETFVFDNENPHIVNLFGYYIIFNLNGY